jgi:hypothetical protein
MTNRRQVTGPLGPSALVRMLLAAGEAEQAAAAAARLIGESFGLDIAGVEFTADEYSLNSVSGRAWLTDGTGLFFKFHQEEREQHFVPEYYRAGLLEAAGLPVETPVAVSGEPGRQVALYRLRTEPRLADICADLERRRGTAARLGPGLAAARRALDRRIGDVLVRTLRPPTPDSVYAAIHQLFYHRLTGPGGRFPGGRYRAWYTRLPCWADLTGLRWRINGVTYSSTLGELAEQSADLLDPVKLARLPVTTAHGDDHNGNIWVVHNRPGGVALRLFDCAFASDDIPVLLAQVKAMFHNALAHPFWLYHPAEAARRFRIQVTKTNGVLCLTHDATPSVLRTEILDSALELIWVPVLGALRQSGGLPANWRAIVRSALFSCPLLVTNLLAADRPVPVRYLGLACAVAAGSEPADGTDLVSQALDRITALAGLDQQGEQR